MTCHTFQSLTRLTHVLRLPAVARALDAHSETCVGCSAYRRAYSAVPEVLRRTHQEQLSERPLVVPALSPRGGLPIWRGYGVWSGLALTGAVLAAAVFVANHPRSMTATAAHPTQTPGDLRRPGPVPATAAVSTDAIPHATSILDQQPETQTAPRDALEVRTPPAPDESYFDGRDAQLMAHWLAGNSADPQVLAWMRRRFPPVQDDFVRIRLPQLATADLKSPAAADAARQYEKQAKVVDARLFHKVTLALKGASLEEFCAEMTKQTGVTLRATRGIADEKVTVFVDERPARDVIREVARLFGFFWGRVGEEGSYKYDLEQDLRSQLAEEDMRNRDLHEALLAVDAQLEAQRGLLGDSVDQLQARAAAASGLEKERLDRLVKKGGWGGLQAYHRLTPAERTALLSGQDLTLRSGGTAGGGLPEQWVRPILQSCTSGVSLREDGIRFGGSNDTGRLVDVPGAQPKITLKLDRSELGQLSLESGLSVDIPLQGGGKVGVGTATSLAVGRSPSASNPDNAAANRSLKDQPPFTRTVSLRPTPSCTQPIGKDSPRAAASPHVSSADVWEALHRETKLPVVADYYTHLYDATSMTVQRASLFDALCRVGDAAGVRWRKDGDFLLSRSTSYFWDKLKEVPNRALHRWQDHRYQASYLPFEDFLEMATCTEAQLNSRTVAPGIVHCWSLPEWNLLSTNLRPHARFAFSLDLQQRKQALSDEGLRYADLNASQQRELLSVLGERFSGPVSPEDARQVRLARVRVGYVPAGWYSWGNTELPVAGRTPEEALAAAQRIEPSVTPAAIQRSRGDFAMAVTLGNGEQLGWGFGRGWGHRATVPPPPSQ